MARIMGIDYGSKRIGLAVTDPLQIIVNGLDTVPKEKIFDYLSTYLESEQVEKIVVGEPLHLDGRPAKIAGEVNKFISQIQKQFPNIPVVTHDERFTSKSAKEILLKSGARKKKRRDKALVDKLSAVLILQDYLQHYTQNPL